jgi:hypothetical protein
MMKNKKLFFPLFLEFVLKNLMAYLILSLVYLDFNLTNWWLIQNVWGRLIIIILELGTIGNTFKSLLEDVENKDKLSK